MLLYNSDRKLLELLLHIDQQPYTCGSIGTEKGTENIGNTKPKKLPSNKKYSHLLELHTKLTVTRASI